MDNAVSERPVKPLEKLFQPEKKKKSSKLISRTMLNIYISSK